MRKALDALALAADQYTRHCVSNFAGFGQGCVRSVPSRMVHVVPGGPSFAMAALAAGAAMHDDLMRPSDPVFVDEEIGGVGRGSGGLCDHSSFVGDLLQLGARVAAHRQK